jgi:hypothetical protein
MTTGLNERIFPSALDAVTATSVVVIIIAAGGESKETHAEAKDGHKTECFHFFVLFKLLIIILMLAAKLSIILGISKLSACYFHLTTTLRPSLT